MGPPDSKQSLVINRPFNDRTNVIQPQPMKSKNFTKKFATEILKENQLITKLKKTRSKVKNKTNPNKLKLLTSQLTDQPHIRSSADVQNLIKPYYSYLNSAGSNSVQNREVQYAYSNSNIQKQLRVFLHREDLSLLPVNLKNSADVSLMLKQDLTTIVSKEPHKLLQVILPRLQVTSIIINDNKEKDNHNKPQKLLQVILHRLQVSSIIINDNKQKDNQTKSNATNTKNHITSLKSKKNNENKVLTVLLKRVNLLSMDTALNKLNIGLSENTTRSTAINLKDVNNSVNISVPCNKSNVTMDNGVSYLVPELAENIDKQNVDLASESHKLLNARLTVILERIGVSDIEKNYLNYSQFSVNLEKVDSRQEKNCQKKELLSKYLVSVDVGRNNLTKSKRNNVKKNAASSKQLEKEEVILENVREITKKDLLEKTSNKTSETPYKDNLNISNNMHQDIYRNYRRHQKNYAHETLGSLTSSEPTKNTENKVPVCKQIVYNKASKVSENANQSNLQISNNIRRNLRKRDKKNYLEEIMSDSEHFTPSDPNKKTVENKVPVYRQIIKDKKKEEKDAYEFDESSSDDKKPKKAKKKRKSSMFDKTTYDILQKIQDKEDKVKKKREKKAKICGGSYGTNHIVQKNQIEEKVIVKRGPKPKNSGKSYEATVNNIIRKVMKKADEQKNTGAISNANKDFDVLTKRVNFKKNNEEKQRTSGVVPISKNVAMKSKMQKTFDEMEICDKTYEIQCPQARDDNLFGFDIPSPASSPVKIYPRHNFPSENMDSLQVGDDNLFGFDMPSPASSPVKTNPRINILSNITLNTSNVVASPSQFDLRRPNANSTFVQIQPVATTSKRDEGQVKGNMLTEVNNLSRSPWRFNLYRQRNPHFLNIKDSGLPCLDQEMVLDHTHVKNIEERCSKTPRKLTVDRLTKSPRQTSILDFIDSSEQDKENMPLRHSLLYDYEDFNSPVKSRSNQIAANKVQVVKRNVLATVDNNRLNLINKTVEIEIDYFGFEDSFELEDEKSARAKPSRIDISLLKKYPSKKGKAKTRHVTIAEPIKQLETEPMEVIEEGHLEVDSNERNEAAHSEVDSNEVKLFEDPEELLDRLSPALKEKRGRRKRLNSVSSDVSDYAKPRKRGKGAKTRAEEAEFEKWVSKFNLMCKEVEEHELEIE